MNLIRDIVEGNLKSAFVCAPFDEAKSALESKGYRIISAQEIARLRMQEGADSSVSQKGNYTRESVLYIPKKGILLARNSPILDNAKEATNCHRNRKEFYLTDEQVESALADSVKFTGKDISTNRFADDEITAFAFGKDAKAYGEFLKEAGIDSISTHATNIGNKPFARQPWLYSLDGRSCLIDRERDLDCNSRVRGVSESGEAITQRTETIPIGKLLNPWDIEIPKYDNLVFGGRR